MAPEPSIQIERLNKRHDREGFDCGDECLNEFLRMFANQNAAKGLSITYVAVESGNDTILGFYSISSGQVACNELPEDDQKRLPRYPIPVIRIGRLATSLEKRRAGIGKLLLIDALQRALVISEDLGVFAVEVDAKSAEAKEFYRRYGFEELKDNQLHLYLSIKTIRKLFSGG